jgi:exodeoxyribonuclease VII small subunit
MRRRAPATPAILARVAWIWAVAKRPPAKLEVKSLTDQAPGSIDEMSFDAALAALERTVAELEAGGQPLERAIALYEQGVALQQHCERLLGDAELRVRRLVEGARGALAEAELKDGEVG